MYRKKSDKGSTALLEQMEQRLLLAAYGPGDGSYPSYPTGISITESSTFTAGTFTLGAAVTIDAPGITVTGVGQGTTFLLASGTGFNMIVVDEDNVTISGMTLDGDLQHEDMIGIEVLSSSNVDLNNMAILDFGNIGASYTGTGSGHDITNSTFNNNSSMKPMIPHLFDWEHAQIFFKTQDNVTIDSVHVQDSNDVQGILFLGGDTVIVSNSTVDRTGYSGIVGSNSGDVPIGTSNMTVTGNTIDVSSTSSTSNAGIEISHGAYGVISGNTITNSDVSAIGVRSDHVIITNNTIIDFGLQGTGGPQGIGITGDNHGTNPAAAVENATVTGNTISNAVLPATGSSFGVFFNVVDSTSLTDGSVISGNTIDTVDVGVAVENLGTPDDTTRLRVLNNTITDADSMGIFFGNNGGGGCIVQGNTITDTGTLGEAGAYGIYVGTKKDMQILDNVITNVEGFGGSNTGGIVLHGSMYGIIRGNLVTDHNGISVTATSPNAVVEGNVVDGSYANGIYVGGGSSFTRVINNVIKDVYDGDTNPAYNVGPAAAVATVAILDDDDDAAPTVTISATDADATELGETTGEFTVTRTGSTASALTVGYDISGTAIDSFDYTPLNGEVVIPAASSTATITVTPIDDIFVEGSETVTLTLPNQIPTKGVGIHLTGNMGCWVFGNRIETVGNLSIQGQPAWQGNTGDQNSGDSARTAEWTDISATGVDTLTYAAGVVRFDFNGDTFVDATDIDLLSAAMQAASTEIKFDMDGDSDTQTLVDTDDRLYLIEEIFVTALGDAQLDHDVDVNDLNLWKASRFTTGTGWATGDFEGDADTDVNDLNLWKVNRFTTYSSVVDLLA